MGNIIVFMFEDLTKTELYAILTGIFTACLIVSNITAGKTFDFFSFTLPCAVIIFPVIYIVNDVLAEVYGYNKARKVILLGFFMNLVAVICYNITIWLPAPVFFENSQAFSIVLSSTLRLLIASFAAYLVGSLVNAKVMVYLKKWDEKYIQMAKGKIKKMKTKVLILSFRSPLLFQNLKLHFSGQSEKIQRV